MSLTWDQIGNLGLSAGQKNKLAAAEAIGVALRPGEPTPDLSTITAAQAKAIFAFCQDVQSKIIPASRGAARVITKVKADASAAAEAAIPTGSL